MNEITFDENNMSIIPEGYRWCAGQRQLYVAQGAGLRVHTWGDITSQPGACGFQNAAISGQVY